MGIIQDPRECSGQHRYFVAETGSVESIDKGKVFVVIVCTSCGESKLIEHTVSGSSYIPNKKG